MAVAAGLTIYEMGALAALALSALFLASPQGQQATRQAAKSAADAVEKIGQKDPEPEPTPDPKKPISVLPPIPQTTVECPGRPTNDRYCEELWDKIRELTERERPPTPPGGGFPEGTKGLKWRWYTHACNKGNWDPMGKKAINHLEEYRKQARALKTKLEEWQNSRCSAPEKPYKLPEAAEKYADSTKEPVLGSKVDIDGNPIPCDQLSL